MNSNSSETDILGSERGSETKTKSSERSSETKDLIIDIIKQDPHITAAEIAMQLNMSSRGIEKQIRKLRELGKIKRTGGRFGGYWEIVIYENTIPSFTSLSLQWQGDQVAKALLRALWHTVRQHHNSSRPCPPNDDRGLDK